MKKLALCFIVFLGIFGSSAFADDRLYRFSQSDMDMIFHRDSAPLELAMLSPYEMQTTEGEWIPFVGAIVGAFYTGAYNISYQIGLNRGWNWRQFGGAVVGGAISGYKYLTPAGMLQVAAFAPTIMGLRVVKGKLVRSFR